MTKDLFNNNFFDSLRPYISTPQELYNSLANNDAVLQLKLFLESTIIDTETEFITFLEETQKEKTEENEIILSAVCTALEKHFGRFGLSFLVDISKSDFKIASEIAKLCLLKRCTGTPTEG